VSGKLGSNKTRIYGYGPPLDLQSLFLYVGLAFQVQALIERTGIKKWRLYSLA